MRFLDLFKKKNKIEIIDFETVKKDFFDKGVEELNANNDLHAAFQAISFLARDKNLKAAFLDASRQKKRNDKTSSKLHQKNLDSMLFAEIDARIELTNYYTSKIKAIKHDDNSLIKYFESCKIAYGAYCNQITYKGLLCFNNVFGYDPILTAFSTMKEYTSTLSYRTDDSFLKNIIDKALIKSITDISEMKTLWDNKEIKLQDIPSHNLRIELEDRLEQKVNIEISSNSDLDNIMLGTLIHRFFATSASQYKKTLKLEAKSLRLSSFDIDIIVDDCVEYIHSKYLN